jgi:MFS family permease
MFWIKVVFIALHSLMFGVGLAALGPYLAKGNIGSILNDIKMEETWKQSAATALTLLGAMISALTTSIPTGIFGNRKMLIFNSLLWSIGGLFLLPYNLYTLLAGRFVTGIAVGFSSTLAPVLLSEISHPQQKGAVTSMHQVSITFGIFVMGILSKWMVKVEHGWWWINSIWFIVIGVLMFFTGFYIPESPLWLLKNGREDEAEATLRALREGFDYSQANSAAAQAINGDSEPLLNQNSNISSRSPSDANHMTSGLDGYDLDHLRNNTSNQHDLAVNQELQELRTQIKSSSSSSSTEVTWGEVFTARYRPQIIMGTCLMLASSLIGINAVTMFTTKIFGFAGLNEDKAIYGTMAASTASFLSSFIAMLTIERLGRKTLFVTAAVGCCISLAVLGTSLLALNHHKSTQGTIAVVSVLAYIFSFNFGLGGVPWALLPEISASKIRAKFTSYCCFLNWLGNLVIVMSTLPLVNILGGGDSDDQQKKGAAILFLIYLIFGVFALLFGMFRLIETKGLSEAQIQMKLGNDEMSSQAIGGGGYFEQNS